VEVKIALALVIAALMILPAIAVIRTRLHRGRERKRRDR
jgi:hypothetical protein